MAIRTHTAKDGTKTFGVRIHRGGGNYEWVGSFSTRREARRAELEALANPRTAAAMVCREWADRFLARYERERKDSSTDTARSALRRFSADFGDRPLDGITRIEAMDWAERVPAGGWRSSSPA